MKINTIKIKNFRGIPDMEISLERILLRNLPEQNMK